MKERRDLRTRTAYLGEIVSPARANEELSLRVSFRNEKATQWPHTGRRKASPRAPESKTHDRNGISIPDPSARSADRVNQRRRLDSLRVKTVQRQRATEAATFCATWSVARRFGMPRSGAQYVEGAGGGD